MEVNELIKKEIYRYGIIVATIILSLIILVFCIIIPLIQNHHEPTGYVDILVAPADATITINGESYRNAIYEFKPGSYTAEISKNGFKTKETSFVVKENQTFGLYLYLNQSNDRWDFYTEEKNLSSYRNLMLLNGYDTSGKKINKNIGTIDNSKIAEKFATEQTIKTVLPISYSKCTEPASRANCNYIMAKYDYSQNCNNSLCLILTGRSSTLNEDMLNGLKNRITEAGYDFYDYKYTYIWDDI